MLRSNIDYIIVGLGNVGHTYRMTRHNMGFIVLDEMARKWDFQFNKTKFQSLVSNVKMMGKKILFMKPITYMNNSGLAVAEAINFYKMPINNVLIIYDDITLDLGKIKIKKKGSSGGHNGVKSIIELVDSDEFLRIKVGISSKPTKDYKLSDWVLSRFDNDDINKLKCGVKLANQAIELIIKDNIDVAMNEYNRRC